MGPVLFSISANLFSMATTKLPSKMVRMSAVPPQSCPKVIYAVDFLWEILKVIQDGIISSMKSTLMERPPLSYKIPFPSLAIVLVAPGGLWLGTIRVGGCSDVFPTSATMNSCYGGATLQNNSLLPRRLNRKCR